MRFNSHMTQYALVVALKNINPDNYNGYDGREGCEGAEVDAENILTLLKDKGFEEKNIAVLTNEQATHDAVLNVIQAAAEQCKRGDLFLFYFSGHGSQIPDKNGDERDRKDETRLCYDKEITDDEFDVHFHQFNRAVRLLVLEDCCHADDASEPLRMSSAHKSSKKNSLKASLIHIGASHAGTEAFGNSLGGYFTRALCHVMRQEVFASYSELRDAIQTKIEKVTPQQLTYREAGPTTSKVFNRFRQGALFADEEKEEVLLASGVRFFKPAPEPVVPSTTKKSWFRCC